MRSALRGLLLRLLPVFMFAACEQEEMSDQPKYESYETAEDLPGGVTQMTPPEGTVARGELVTERAPRPPLSAARLERGRDVFNRMCAPCHSPVGDGQGMVVLRGFPAPPSFHTPRLREVSDTHIYDVITNGYGVMYPYANRVSPEERWAVVDYIRALQLSQHADVVELPPEIRRKLEQEK